MKGKRYKLNDDQLKELKEIIIDSFEYEDSNSHDNLADAAVQLIQADELWIDDRSKINYTALQQSIKKFKIALDERKAEIKDEMMAVSPGYFDRSNKKNNICRPPFSRANGEELPNKDKYELKKK